MGGDNVTHTLVSLSRGAGAACADRLPDTFSFFPVNGCSSDRESGSLRLPGGWGSWARVGRWSAPRRRSLTSARRGTRARGAGAACAHLLPDTFPPLPVNRCSSGRESGRGCRAWAVGLGRWSAPRRRSLTSARRRVLASGEGRLVLTSSRILLCLSRLTGAVLTANRVGRGCRAWAVGYRALVDEFKADGTSRRAREGGRGVCVRGVVRLDGPAAENFARDVRFFPLHTKVWPARRPSPPPPGTGLAARSASVASHTALFAQPQRAVRCRAHPAPAPLFRLCTGWPPTR